MTIFKVTSTPEITATKKSDKTERGNNKKKFIAKKKAHKMKRGAIKTKKSIFAISTPMGNKN